MNKLLLQFKHKDGAPTIKDACNLFDLKVDEIDAQFGIIETDPIEKLYTMRVSSEAKERIEKKLKNNQSDPAEGIFSDSHIEVFDEPKK